MFECMSKDKKSPSIKNSNSIIFGGLKRKNFSELSFVEESIGDEGDELEDFLLDDFTAYAATPT